MDKHYIVLNGKRYDAVTGALLGPDNGVSAHLSRSHTHTAKTVHAPRAAVSPRHAVPEQHHMDLTAAQPIKKPRVHHASPIHIAHHKPQPAKTLMRRAVKKPEATATPYLKSQYPVLKSESGITIGAPKRLAHNVDDLRVKRSQNVPKSTQIGRFQAQSLTPIKPHIAPISVAVPKAHEHDATTHHAAKKPASVKKVDIFEEAIAAAKSHEEKSPKTLSRRRKFVGVSAGLATVLVLGGFFAAMNQPMIEMQIASVRAGFKINEPTYTPSGFVREQPSVAGKSVALTYSSVNGAYTLSQESSGWNSQTLYDSITMKYGSNYSILYSNGRTIYVYETNNAAWVDGGTLYRITGNAQLNSEQILSIVNSI